MVSVTSGKSWGGKEKALEAFVSLTVDAKQYLHSDEIKMREIELVSAIRKNFNGNADLCSLDCTTRSKA